MARNDKKIPEKKTVVPEFSNLQDAKAKKEKAEKKLERIKKFLIVGIVAQCWLILVFVVMGFLPEDADWTMKVVGYLFLSWVIVDLVALILTGGVGSTFSTAWAISKKIGYVGWFLVPFPIDIFTGIILTGFGISFFISSVLMAPLYFIYRNKKEQEEIVKAASQYIVVAEA